MQRALFGTSSLAAVPVLVLLLAAVIAQADCTSNVLSDCKVNSFSAAFKYGTSTTIDSTLCNANVGCDIADDPENENCVLDRVSALQSFLVETLDTYKIANPDPQTAWLPEQYQFGSLRVAMCDVDTNITYTPNLWNNVIAPSRLWASLDLGPGADDYPFVAATTYQLPFAFTSANIDEQYHNVMLPETGKPAGTFLSVRNFIVVRLFMMRFLGPIAPADWDQYSYDELCTVYNENFAPTFFDIENAEVLVLGNIQFSNMCLSNPTLRYQAKRHPEMYTRDVTRGFFSFRTSWVNVALRSTPMVEMTDVGRVLMQSGGFWGVQYPESLDSRSLWTMDFSDDFVSCNRDDSTAQSVRGCQVTTQDAAFVCFGVSARADGPSNLIRGIDPLGNGNWRVPAILSWNRFPSDSNWERLPVGLFTNQPLSLLRQDSSATAGSNSGATQISPSHCSAVAQSNFDPTFYSQPQGYGPMSYAPLALSWEPAAVQVTGDLDIWCESPLYLPNTTHSSLTGDSSLCVSCPLPFIGRGRSREDLTYFQTEDPTQFEFLEVCNDICPPGQEPNYYQTGCQSCADDQFSYQGQCNACPTDNSVGSSEDRSQCLCSPGYVFTPRNAANVPECTQCGTDTVSNAVLNRCLNCSAGLGSQDGTTCTACPENTYNPDGTGCRSCPADAVDAQLVAVDDQSQRQGRVSCRCAPGYAFDLATASCQQCEARLVNPADPDQLTVGSSTECLLCPLGQRPNDDRSECVLCASTQQALVPGVCHDCGYGLEYNPRRDQCLPCADGFIALFGSECTPCPIGTTSDPAHTECVACPEGTFSSGNGPCSECSAGLVPDASQTQCVCPDGYVENPTTTLCEYAT